MFDKKTFVFAVVVSWILTLLTVLLVTNFVPSIVMSSNQQSVSIKGSKIINLVKQDVVELEQIIGSPVLRKVFNFTWSPSNPNENAILEIVGFFEYRLDTNEEKKFDLTASFSINDFSSGITVSRAYDSNGDWQLVSFKINPSEINTNWINPKQTNYPIKLGISCFSSDIVSVRNVNLILLVVDG